MKKGYRRDYGYVAMACPVLEQEWDADIASYQGVIVEKCLRGETLEPSPDALGIHANDGALFETWHLYRPTWPEKSVPAKVKFCAPVHVPEPRTNYYPEVLAFPHSTEAIAMQTIQNWESVGEEDAARRGISVREWLWKRSRFLAGFR